MSFNYSKLRGRIREKYNTETEFSKVLGMGRVSLSKRLNNSLEFSQNEIIKSCELLGISGKEMPEYFFQAEVQKGEQGGCENK